MVNLCGLLILIGATVFLSWSQALAGSTEGHHRVKRIIGGRFATDGKWPWLVSLEGKIPRGPTLFGLAFSYTQYHCGAAVISNRWILTAAHCFGAEGTKQRHAHRWEAKLATVRRKKKFIDVFMHFVGRLLNKKEWQRWEIDAEKIIIHPHYSQTDSWLNDIALVKLERPVPSQRGIVEDIQEIDLPEQDSTFPDDSVTCVMAGWGCNAQGEGVVERAHEVDLPKVSDRTCGSIYAISTHTRLCAGHDLKGKGICPGDSGGPLMCPNGNNWILSGVASFTSQANPQDFPGAFTRVSAYVNWIRRTIREN